MRNAYGSNQGYPYTYGNVLTMYGAGATQLFMGWNSSSNSSTGVHADAYIRSQRDTDGSLWSDWVKLLDTNNYKTYAWARPSSITSDQVLISSGTNGSTTLRAILNNTTATALGWNNAGNTHADNLRLVDVNTLAYWNGAYSGTSSNLAYYKGGAFGTMAKETAADYAKLSSAAFTGAVTVQAPTADANPATKKYVDDQITAGFAANDAMVFKGVLNKDATETATTLNNVPKSGYSAGWTYRVAKEGTYAGVACEVGDMVIAVTDAATNQTAANNAHWNVIQANIDGAVIGPAAVSSGRDNSIVRFDGETGKLIQGSKANLDDNGNFLIANDASIKFYRQTNTTYGSESYAIQTCFDDQDPATSAYTTTYEHRCNLLLQPRGGQVYIGTDLTSTGDTNYSLYVTGDTYLKNKLIVHGLEIKGHIAGDAGTTGHGLYSGGGYHNAYNNIILHGDSSTGSSGIAFISDKIGENDTVTTINQPSDRAFIQYHACGVTTPTAENTAPTIATSGEKGIFIIGIGNDGTGSSQDQLWLQTNDHLTLIHQIAANSYVIPDTGNTTGSVGNATQPVYIDAGVIKACTAYANASVNYATSAGGVAWTNVSGKPIEFGTYSGALNTNGWKTLGGRSSGSKIYISYNNNSATWNSETYSASMVFGCQDTKGLLDIGYNNPIVTFGGSSATGGTDNDPKWYFKLSATSGQTYTFPTTSKTLAAADGSNASFNTSVLTGGTLGTDRGGTGTNAHTANRLAWSYTASKVQAGYHYANETKVGINLTSEPTTNFYVNGTSYLNGATTINGNLIFPTANLLDWNSDTYRQRIAITDDSTTNTAVFTFQQSTNSGSSYTDLFTIKDNGTVVATTFDGNATSASKATGVIDAGNANKVLTIRYSGNGAAATDWIPMHDSNGNLVPVSSENLANKVRDKASGDWDINITGISKYTKQYYTTNSTDAPLQVRSNNKNVYIWQAGHATSESGGFSNNYALQYYGEGSSPNNYLILKASNSSTVTDAVQVDENGNITVAKTITGTIANSTWATLLKPINTATTASASTWSIPSGSYQVWGERFSDTRLKYTPSGGSESTVTDTGDWTMWLTSGGTSNTATLNMRIDGTYYGSFSGNLSGNASSSTSASYLATTQLTNENLNDYMSPNPRWYYAVGGNTVTNKPTGVNAFGLYVYRNADVYRAQELYDSNGNKWMRHLAGSSWTAWEKVLTSANYDDYALPLSGGTMSGTITLANTGLKTPQAAGFTTDQFGNFKHQQATASDTWQLLSNAGAANFKYAWETGALTLAGGLTAGGQILTSFKSSVAMGSYGPAQNTIPNLLEEVRYSSGCAGSFNLTTAYTLNNVTLATGWYNFIWVPHRSGGVNGAASGDNCDYGALYLHRMNVAGYADYVLAYSSGAAKLLDLHASFQSTITDGQIIIADGTAGHIKTSGYTTSSFATAGHTHNYAGSSSAGGAANSAVKLSGGLEENDISTYTNFKLTTAKGGYYGFLVGNSTSCMNVMGASQHNGLYQQAKGRWIIYYDGTNDRIALGNSTTHSGYIVSIGGNMYVNGNTLTTGTASASTISVTNTDANPHLNFSRTGGHTAPNYINIPSSSALAVSVGGAAGTNIAVMVENKSVNSFNDAETSLGTSTYEWKETYSKNYVVGKKVKLEYNSTDDSLDFIFI